MVTSLMVNTNRSEEGNSCCKNINNLKTYD